MSEKQKAIVWDADGVITDLREGIKQYIRLDLIAGRLPEQLTAALTEFLFILGGNTFKYDITNYLPADYVERMFHGTEVYHLSPLVPSTLAAMWYARSEGVVNIILTARPQPVHGFTKAWVKDENIPADKIIFSGNHEDVEQVKILKKDYITQIDQDYDLKFVVEDCYQNLEAMDIPEVRKVLLTRPWNRHSNIRGFSMTDRGLARFLVDELK